MSERLTSVRGPKGSHLAIAEHGFKTRPEMVAKFRSYYQRQLEDAQRALALTDDELVVTTYRGAWARTGERVVTD